MICPRTEENQYMPVEAKRGKSVADAFLEVRCRSLNRVAEPPKSLALVRFHICEVLVNRAGLFLHQVHYCPNRIISPRKQPLASRSRSFAFEASLA